MLEISGSNAPKDWFLRLPAVPLDAFPVLLDSSEPSEELSRYSLLAAYPFGQLSWSEGRTTWSGPEFDGLSDEPFAAIQTLLETYRVTTDPPYPLPAGFAAGYISYDLGHFYRRLPPPHAADCELPEVDLRFYDVFWVYDHLTGDARWIEVDLPGIEDRAERRARFQEMWTPDAPTEPLNLESLTAEPISATMSWESYRQAVVRAKKHIRDGDIYQVNLSQRYTLTDTRPTWERYLALRSASPAPFGAAVLSPDGGVLSSSPERFISVHGQRIETRPIKGTRKRSTAPDEDAALKNELLSSSKDDAELAMIVDLERNDLGQICDYGSVTVRKAKRVETWPTVHHLVAVIDGELRDDVSVSDILLATFPGGSITGAPKKRSMEIIHDLEPTRRHAYTGAIGYFGFDGQIDLSIAIRVILIDGDRTSFQVGGAIVDDSIPEAEYEETITKATGMCRALGIDPEALDDR